MTTQQDKDVNLIREAKRELMDDEGENRAVRGFLMLYGQPGVTAMQMKRHMELLGYPYAPDWVERSPGSLTKAGAQLWLRMLFDLELTQPAPLALSAEDAAMWNAKVNAAKHLSAIYGADSLIGLVERAILAVDALLRKRVTPLTDEQIIKGLSAAIEMITQAEAAAFRKGVKFAEAAHGIGGAK